MKVLKIFVSAAMYLGAAAFLLFVAFWFPKAALVVAFGLAVLMIINWFQDRKLPPQRWVNGVLDRRYTSGNRRVGDHDRRKGEPQALGQDHL